ncbi:hypothetical protein [uncultured Akkermansia sp.]|uniref:hypothetical protein n=1 Tax=uncultured Akkermansia sp. TaxID=512294 RepID=UPI0026209F6D|nr:hypothetical protein [uncultured Akkermansia sp.]
MLAALTETTAVPDQLRHGLPIRARNHASRFSLSKHRPNYVLPRKRNGPLNIKRFQSICDHLRISNPQSIKFFEKKGLSSYRERKKSQRILKETIPNIDFIH